MTPYGIRVAIVGAPAEAQWWERQANGAREACLIQARSQCVSGVPAADQWHDAVRDSAVDAVCVCGPLVGRAELITAALHAGKHVLAVPPIATDWQSVRRMAKDALDRDVVLQTALPDRHRPAVVKVRSWITAGAIGAPLVLTCRVGGPTRDAQGASLADSLETLMARATGVASWFMGGFTEVIGLDSPAGDTAAAFFSHSTGSTAWVQVSPADDTVAFEVEIIGREGYATAHSGGERLERATLGPRDHTGPFRETAVQSTRPDTYGASEWEGFAAAIRARGCRDEVEYTLTLMRLFLAARRSAHTGSLEVASQASGMVAKEA